MHIRICILAYLLNEKYIIIYVIEHTSVCVESK